MRAPTTKLRETALEVLQRPIGRWLPLLAPLLLYAAALNPLFAPGSYDEILYHSGAVSLAEEGAFKFRDLHISDWPPGFSALLAIPFRVAGPSVLLAKLCVLLCAGAALVLALRLFQKEQRSLALLSIVLFALLPFSFSLGTRVLSEWPYVLASMLFLLALFRARASTHPIRDGVIAGLCIGAAALTKFTGVVLGAAIMAQAIQKWRKAESSHRLRAIAPEMIAAALGAAAFFAWKLKIHWQIAAGTAAPYEYYRSGLLPEHFGRLAPLSLPEKLSELFFRSDAIFATLGWSGWLPQLALALPALLVVLGLATRLRSGNGTPSDWYVIAMLILFASFADNKQTRYLMPITPFLVHYALLGGARVLSWIDLARRPLLVWTARGAVAGWMLLSLGISAQLLLRGNPAGGYGGLSPIICKTPEEFYRGRWLDLYRACEQVRNDPAPGSIAVIGGEDKYVTHFTRRRWIDFEPAAEFAFLLVLNGEDLPRHQSAGLRLQCVQRGDAVVLYKRAAAVATEPDPQPEPALTSTPPSFHDTH